MSLLTQCPACQTYYRVVPDQLRISDGWVKCGNCSDIFDASQHLIEIDLVPGTDDNPPQAETSSGELANGSSEGTHGEASVVKFSPETLNLELPQEARDDPIAVQYPSAISSDQVASRMPDFAEMDVIERPAGSAIEPAWVNESETDMSRDLVPDLEFPEGVVASNAEVVSEPQRVRWDDVLPSQQVPNQPSSELESSEPPVTFLREQAIQKTRQGPLVRGGLALMMVVLLMTLVGQWVYRERDKLAASKPELKPAFQTACAWLGCVIQPVRQLDALAIDSAAFNKLDKDTYRLSFLVKNAHELPVAYPAIELVLTDADDQPVYRRVLSSAELGFKAAELSASAEWPVSVTLRIDAVSTNQRVFGYRLLVFYP